MPSTDIDNPTKWFETWDNFGKNLKNYIINNKEYLEKENFDIILGFSRGGVILAFAFACLLKDHSKKYSKLQKASVRPIPNGIVRKINDPCFIMNQAASNIEIDDILNNLESELKKFSKDYAANEKLNILLMDDNLSGATRVKYLEDILEDMKSSIVHEHKTLAYVRHKLFSKEEIPTIIDFPEKADIFIMPWHDFHETRDLKFKNEENDLTKLNNFKLILRFKKHESVKDIEKFFKDINKEKFYRFKCNFIINGASEFLTQIDNATGYLKLNYMPNKIYPPKRCLKPQNSDANGDDMAGIFYPLCQDANPEPTGATCLACSIINCNRELFRRVLVASNGNNFAEIDLKYEGENSETLKEKIEICMKELINDISLMII